MCTFSKISTTLYILLYYAIQMTIRLNQTFFNINNNKNKTMALAKLFASVISKLTVPCSAKGYFTTKW